MFSRLISYVERGFTNISGVLIMIMMFLTTMDVALRQFFNSPIKGAYELQVLMLPAIVYLGISYVQSQRNHIVMDAITSQLSVPNQAIFRLIGDTIFLLISVTIAWQMSLQAWEAAITGDYLFGAIPLPVAPTKFVITFGMALLSLRLISGIIRNPLWRRIPGQEREYFIRLIITMAIFAFITIAALISKHMDLSPAGIGYISLCLFLILLICGTPIGGSMALIGIWGFWLLQGKKSALGIAGLIPYSSAAEYTMTVMPMFIIMGSFTTLAGFAQAGFTVARKWLEGFTGGMVQATVLGATAFAASSGSSIASCAILAKVALPEMLKNGVQKGLAIGVVGTASTLAAMIPPSGQFVIYGMVTGTSVGKLLISGVVPGIIGSIMIMLSIYIRCKLDPSLVTSIPFTRTPWKERFQAIPQAWGLIAVAIIIIGGLYSGFFTPTEAGAIGAFVAFLAMLILKKAGWKDLADSLLEAGGISSTVLFVLVGGILFGNMIAMTRIPNIMSEWIVGLDVSPIIILICIIFMYLLLGCLMDTVSTMMITLPIIFPIIVNLGFDPIWFGVMMVLNAEMGCITPPFGMNLFVLKGTVKDVTLNSIYSGVSWFIIPMALTMIICIVFPQVTLWLPNMMTAK